MLPNDYPLKRDLLEDAGDVNLLLGRAGEAVKLYQRGLAEGYRNNLHNGDIVHKLFAARVLRGERVDLESCKCEDDSCPWRLVLMSADALLLKENNTALLFAEKAKEVSQDWVTGSSACLVEALAHLVVGNMENAATFCRQAAATMESGGLSLLSFGLHWVLSQVEGDPLRKRHVSTWKSIARQLGITSGFKAFQSKLNSLAASECVFRI
jgi:hypothetical protein